MKIAWLFPGQGSQSVGMGSSWLQGVHENTSTRLWNSIDQRLYPYIKRSLRTICQDGPEDVLTQTAITQPAIVATSLVALAALRNAIPSLPNPVVALGHSLGEYAALTAAELMSVEDACVAVHLRGKAMQEAVPMGTGAMAAVIGFTADDVHKYCEIVRDMNPDWTLSAANFNAPGQVVIAGHTEAVEQFIHAIEGKNARCVRLKVSAPFHCALMKPARTVIETVMHSIAIKAPVFPVISNVTATIPEGTNEYIQALIHQVDSPVRWQESVELLPSLGVTHAIEIGPGKVLSGLMKRIAPDIHMASVFDNDGIQTVASWF